MTGKRHLAGLLRQAPRSGTSEGSFHRYCRGHETVAAPPNGDAVESGLQGASTREDAATDEDSFPSFDKEAEQLLAEELSLAEASGSPDALEALSPHLSSLVFEAVKSSTSICASHDASPPARGAEATASHSRHSTQHQHPEAGDSRQVAGIIAAAEEARMHNWTLAGCDNVLKVLVAAAVRVAKRTELFCAYAHASFL